MDDLTALLAAIITAPDEDLHRLVYADRLDERGEPGDRERAEFVRVQVELHRLPSEDTVPSKSATRKYKLLMREDELREEGDLFPWGRDMAGVGFKLERGFIPEIECDAPTFLRHADALLWHPTQLQVCRRCDGDGKAHGSDRPFGYSGPGSYPGPCPVCKGSGRGTEPRPCPPTAQPIRRVVLTTVPLSSGRSDNVPLPSSWFRQRWPGVEFVLPTHTATMANAAALYGMEVPVSTTELYEAAGLTPPTE